MFLWLIPLGVVVVLLGGLSLLARKGIPSWSEFDEGYNGR